MTFIVNNIESDDPNEIAILIDGNRFRFWTNSEINLSMDSIDSFSLSAPFEADVSKFRETFKPLSYKPVTVYIGGELVLNGTMMNVSPSVDSNSRVLSIGGYSLPGVLNDCPFPFSEYPIEFNNQNLQQIAKTAAGFFDVGLSFEESPGALFEKVAAEPGQTVLNFLIGLAQQRGLFTSNTLEGELLFQKSNNERAGDFLKEGEFPYLGASPTYNAQPYYSEITGLSATKSFLDAEKYTINNSLTDSFRPFVFKEKDVSGADLQESVKAKIGRMFGEAVNITVSVQGWRNNAGEIWTPNKKIKLQSPGAMVYNETDFLIRSVSLKRGENDTASLNLILPESFSGEIPGTLPWD